METTAHQHDPVGFAGLTSLVSSIPSAPKPVPAQRAEAPTPKPDAPSPTPSAPQATNPQTEYRRAKSTFTVFWVSAAVIGILVLVGISSNNSRTQYTSPSPQYTSPPSPTIADSSPPAPPAPAYTPPQPEIVEVMPEAASDFVERSLSRNQIYYCLLEKERVNILRSFTSDASEQQVYYFNERVRDYNARCGSYKYYPREMDAAKRQFDAKIAGVRAQFTASLSPPKPAARPPQPSPTFSYTPPPAAVAPSAPPPAPVATAPSAPIEEVIPPYGQGHQHTREQLYYCYAESVRLDWAKKTIDLTSQSQVDSLNGKLTDFSTRCTKFRSDAADRDAVKKQLATKRAALKREGIAMANSWR